MAALVWFRMDLRLDDHPALEAARKTKLPLIPIYIWDESAEGQWKLGAASRSWLHHSLESLDRELRQLDSKLILRVGKSLDEITDVCKTTQASHFFWTRRYEPSHRTVDLALAKHLEHLGVESHCFRGNLLFEPFDVLNKQGKAYQVYSPYYKACTQVAPPPLPTNRPSKLLSPSDWPASISLRDLQLRPLIKWDQDFWKEWTPGVEGARQMFKEFNSGALLKYKSGRDFPAQRFTSRLSPHLHFGEISTRRLWHWIEERFPKKTEDITHFQKELIWREFAYHLLWFFPELPEEPLRPEFKKFPWKKDQRLLRAWHQGRTGYPLVDAGMRELWKTGWMHNRVRMIVASFLVKHLLISWTEGAAWFWDCLVDADLASNTLGWQWASGCGPDAAPYFRIFNPIIQSQKFDADGDYIRRWVPELAKLSNDSIHEPWKISSSELAQKGVVLGENYPHPIVDHQEARGRALDAFEKLKKD